MNPRAASAIALLAAALTAACASDTGARSEATAPQSTQTAPQAPRQATVAAIRRSELRERAIALLEEASFDEWALVRANALEGLIPVPTRAEPVARAALVDDNVGVRFVGAMTVARLHLTRSAPLVRPLLTDPDEAVRIAATYALIANNINADRRPIADALLTSDLRTRAQAAFILGELADDSAIPLLRDATKQLTSAQADVLPGAQVRLTRLQIAEALVKLGDSEAIHPLRAALYPSSQDEFEATVLAIEILGRLEDVDVAAQLIQLIEYPAPGSPNTTDPNRRIYLYPPEVRLAAATALARMSFTDGVYVARQFDTDPNPALRAQAAFLYAVAGNSTPALERLQILLDDSESLVRIAAAASILIALDR